MSRRGKTLYSLLTILIVTLSSTVVFLYFENNSLRGSLEQERVLEQSSTAQDVRYHIETFVSWYYDCISEMQNAEYRVLQGWLSNETRDALRWRNYVILSKYAEGTARAVESDLRNLSSLEPKISYEVSNNISDTVQYAIAQIDWAILARPMNDSYRLLWELYYISGIDQITRGENLTALRGIARAFSDMSTYWYAESMHQPTTSGLKEPQVQIAWALGNATLLYHELTEWHNRNPLS